MTFQQPYLWENEVIAYNEFDGKKGILYWEFYELSQSSNDKLDFFVEMLFHALGSEDFLKMLWGSANGACFQNIIYDLYC